ncbi:MAG: hypothetical protein WC438_05610 [Candidatus Pacearchaeota archaeon]
MGIDSYPRIGDGIVSELSVSPRALESVPAYIPEGIPPVFGGNFSELFHGEFSDFVVAQPIEDTIAPSCPTNIMCVVNSYQKTILYTWYYPNAYSRDESIQNDIKKFSINISIYDQSFTYNSVIPRFKFAIPENLIKLAETHGVKFFVKAVDYHNLVSESSQIVTSYIESDQNCKDLEYDVVYDLYDCNIPMHKKHILKKHMNIQHDSIMLYPGFCVSIKDPFKNSSNVIIIDLIDLNTGKSIKLSLNITHQSVTRTVTTYGPIVSSTSDVIESIRGSRGIGVRT